MKSKLLYIVVALSFASCANHRFTPSNLNMPFFEEKNEYKIDLSYSNQLELHGAYAITDHFSTAAMVSFGSVAKTENYILDYDSLIGYLTVNSSRIAYQLGFGYQTNLKPKLVFENYAGFTYGNGFSKTERTYLDGTPDELTQNNNYNPYLQFYTQPAIGYHGERVSWGFGVKTSFYSTRTPAIGTLIYEPISKFGFGGPRLKCELQAGLRLSKFISGLTYRYVHWGIGLQWRIKGNNEDKGSF